MLMEEGQGHVIAFWAEVGKNDNRKRALGRQLSTIDATYPGGLRAYVRNGQALLAAACRGENPFDAFVPEVPKGALITCNIHQYTRPKLLKETLIRNSALVQNMSTHDR